MQNQDDNDKELKKTLWIFETAFIKKKKLIKKHVKKKEESFSHFGGFCVSVVRNTTTVFVIDYLFNLSQWELGKR